MVQSRLRFAGFRDIRTLSPAGLTTPSGSDIPPIDMGRVMTTWSTIPSEVPEESPKEGCVRTRRLILIGDISPTVKAEECTGGYGIGSSLGYPVTAVEGAAT